MGGSATWGLGRVETGRAAVQYAMRSVLTLTLSLLLGACSFNASTEVLGKEGDTGLPDEGEGGDAAAGGEAGGDSGGGGDEGGAPDPEATDDDGDGFSEQEGDCADADPAVGPGQDDRCDGLDQDCDGRVDEDAWMDDPGEPDDLNPIDLGSVAEDAPVRGEGRLWSDEDTDRYLFTFTDGLFDFYTLYVKLDGIPAGATYRLRVEDPDSGDVLFAEEGAGEINAELGDGLLSAASALHVVVDGIDGVDCGAEYAVEVTFADLWPW